MNWIENKVGVWIIGARGDIATTLIIGALARKKNKISASGLSTELPPLSQLDLVNLGNLRFGGLDIEKGNLRESALTVGQRSGTFSGDMVKELEYDLNAIDRDIVTEPLADWGPEQSEYPSENLSTFVSRVRQQLQRFKRSQQLDTVVVVNLSSSEALPIRSTGSRHSSQVTGMIA